MSWLRMYSIEFKEFVIEKKRKNVQTKIILHYFAGKCSKDNIFISYLSYSNKDEVTVAQEQLQIIKSALFKKKNRDLFTKLNPFHLQLTRNKNGINVKKFQYDQFQINEELSELYSDGFLDEKFKFPTFVKKFREPQISEARKTNSQWNTEVVGLLKATDIKIGSVQTYIKGFYRPDKKNKQQESQFSQSLRVDMSATLTTIDKTVYLKLKNKYDGQKDIIGCQKVHVRIVYQQIIIICPTKTFEALELEFQNLLKEYAKKYPMMKIQTNALKTKNKGNIFIKAISSNRKDFIEPQRVISELFTPKFIKLQTSEFRFIDKTDAGNQVLSKIEDQYDLKIYFGMHKQTQSLKVYCQDAHFNRIQKKVLEEIKKNIFCDEQISYRGKNLNKVKETLQNHKKKLSDKQTLTYQIIFQFRIVQIITDILTFQSVKNQILKLSNSQKGECLICADILRNPYRFINCDCTFCWNCITDHIRAYKNSPREDTLTCPNDDCIAVSLSDVRTLLSQQEFQKICDIKIARHVAKHPYKYVACKFCENIFDRDEVEQAGEVDCQVCGKTQCLKCKQYHPNYTCEEWQSRKSTKTSSSSHVKGKRCPKCKDEIKKKGRSNHIQCSQCSLHICWKCLKFFPKKQLCLSHLNKQCGGIFQNQ